MLPVDSPLLYVQPNGKEWTTTIFFKSFVEPVLRQLAVAQHPGLTKLGFTNGKWDNPLQIKITMYRRGVRKFLGRAGVDPDLVGLMARWAPKAQQRRPGKMSQLYYDSGTAGEPIDCHDLVTITSARPAPSRGLAAQWD